MFIHDTASCQDLLELFVIILTDIINIVVLVFAVCHCPVVIVVVVHGS